MRNMKRRDISKLNIEGDDFIENPEVIILKLNTLMNLKQLDILYERKIGFKFEITMILI